MGRIEILTGRERRRRWSDEEKLRMLSEAEEEGISLAEVARRHDVHPQQLYAWRRLATAAVPAPAFLPVEIAEMTSQPLPGRRRRGRTIEVVLTNGRRLKVDQEIAPETLAQLVRTLERA